MRYLALFSTWLIMSTACASVSFDAYTGSTDTATTAHTPAADPEGVIVTISVDDNANAGTNATAVTYGGVAMTAVTGSPLDQGSVKVTQWFLGSGIPTGEQDVVVTGASSTGSYRVDIVTVQATTDTELQAVVKIAEASQSPTGTIGLGGVECFVMQAGATGRGFVGGVEALAGWSTRSEADLGASCSFCYTYNTVGTADVTIGWTTDASDDQGGFAVAIAEASAPSGNPDPLTPSIPGGTPDPLRGGPVP